MREVLEYYKNKIDKSNILTLLGIKQKNFFVISTHREENVDNPENLKKILIVLNELADTYSLPVIVSTHPRTRKRIEQLGEKSLHKGIQFLKPFGFLDYVHLQQNALCTLSDSGTISEESSILGFPAISLRQSMERPEAQDTGSIILTGFDPDIILNSISMVINETKDRNSFSIPTDYQIVDTSWRVAKLILGNCKLSNLWSGISQIKNNS
jgi:UDP-N-acetylglucosamine 2-epimerase (non-hydrolysing)